VQAVPISLATVAVTALIGAVQTVKEHLLVWQPAVAFIIGGMIGTPFGVMYTKLIDGRWIVSGFALLSITIGGFMWHRTRVSPDTTMVVRARFYSADEGPVCRLSPGGELRFTAPCAAVFTMAGLGTGILSGLFGVGGGIFDRAGIGRYYSNGHPPGRCNFIGRHQYHRSYRRCECALE
jgi:Predicted permeases